MNGVDVLVVLRQRAIEMVVQGDRLRYRPAAAVTAELRQAITDTKIDLLALLRAEVPVDDHDAGRFGRWEHEQATHDGEPMAWYWLPIGPVGSWVCSLCRPSDRPLPIVQRDPSDAAPEEPIGPMWADVQRYCTDCWCVLPRGNGGMCVSCELARYYERRRGSGYVGASDHALDNMSCSDV